MSRHLNSRQNNNTKIHEFSQNIVRVLYIKKNDLVGTCDTHGKMRKSYQFWLVRKFQAERPRGRPEQRWNLQIAKYC
jgi:hypothetical protein